RPERSRRVVRDAAARRLQRLAPAAPRGAFRQREIGVAAFARAAARFIRVPEKVRVGLRGVPVEGGEEHVRALVEDLLRAVAVVIVDVEDGYPSRPRIPQELRGNGGVVQIAVAAVEIGPGVMPRGTAEGEGRRRAGR